MKNSKILLICFLALNLVVPDVYAGKSYSSGGGSRSGGSRSSMGGSSRSSGMGRSSSLGGSSRSSTPSHSYSPPASSSRSSTPSHSYSPPASSSRSSTPSHSYSPPASKPSGKSYSSSLPPAKSATSGNKTYSTGTNPTPTPVATSGNKTYSTGKNTPKTEFVGGNSANKPPPSTVSADGNSRKPGSTSFNSELSNQAKKEESKAAYHAVNPPPITPVARPSTAKYKAPASTSPQVQTVRNYVTHERYVTYDNRAYGFYGGYYGHPVYYNDYYSPWLTAWLLSDAISSHQRALWMYHHYDDMDQSRYQYLLAHDAQLQNEINQLKAQNIARNQGYVPPQMADNPDLMYDKGFVGNVANDEPADATAAIPVQVQAPQQIPTSHSPVQKKSGNTLIWWLGCFVLLGVLYYIFFVKEF